MLKMLFNIHNYKKMGTEIKNNPNGFVGDQAKEIIYGIFLIPFLSALTILTLLFLLGFTSVLIDTPSTLAKVFFFFVLFATLVLFFIVRGLVRMSKKVSKHIFSDTSSQQNTSIDNSKHIYDAEFTVKE